MLQQFQGLNGSKLPPDIADLWHGALVQTPACTRSHPHGGFSFRESPSGMHDCVRRTAFAHAVMLGKGFFGRLPRHRPGGLRGG